ncbi:LAME_0G16270g1_1 [Lachancea meyersii CBS 8951]|uniref:LAME_0G16270g1_1 n=1 Tax=Lachancea meyersii CBS 8951 TaxID=1266667 RepID=A0A1G4KB58_9SACH|nr:LAME_0G16270g1_1 [Lachancea meyersii CBS 8951]
MQSELGYQLGESLLFENSGSSGLSFVGSNGQLANLKRKKKNGSQDISWKSDETYGIDINRLLDQCSTGKDDKAAPQGQKSIKSLTHNLWTEKWKPQSFFDLVGNERTNRRVLKWLRQWSPLVFGETLPKQSTAKWGGSKSGVQDSLEILDPLQRPRKKILLLTGPPGIGKTSVAHVVVKQAGYSVVEINASDERGGPGVKARVHNALFSNTLDGQPVCLVADEIDGSMESGFIKVLIDIINSDFKATQRVLSGAPTKSKGKRQRRKNQGQIMTRPIIAICNNVYASALEKLRPHCEIINFQRPSENAIVERLHHVCRKEKLLLDKKKLKELTELYQGDVRSCLNNMQFMATLASENGSNSLDEQAKDLTVSWYKICNQIFRKDPHVDGKQQFGKLLRDVETNSNYQKIVHGCFSMFPSVKYSDYGLRKPGAAADWLYFNDRMFQSLFEHNGDLMRYNSAVPLAFFQLFSDIANKDEIRTQHNEFEHREALRKNDDLLSAMLQRTLPISQIYMNKRALTLEVLPLLDHIIATDFTKVRNGLVKNAIFENIIPAVTTFDLAFGERSDTDMPRVTCIEPPFDAVVLMDQKRAREIFTKRPSLLNILNAKVQESKLRKRTLEAARVDKENLESARKRQKTSSSSTKPAEFFKSQYASVQSGNSQTVGASDTGGVEPAKVKIWVKHKEGFSDAVRKNVTWKTLWE